MKLINVRNIQYDIGIKYEIRKIDRISQIDFFLDNRKTFQ